MPETPARLDPTEALAAIRTLARVALNTDAPELYESMLREILQACENALPPDRETARPKRS